MRVLRTAVVAASVAWMLLLVVVPFLVSRPHASALGTALVVAVYSVGSLICHQLPERSYRLWGAQMPVCARCAGIYIGAATAALVSSGAGRTRAFGALPSLPEARVRSERASTGGFQPGVRIRPPERLALQKLPPTGVRLTLAIAVAPALATLIYEWVTGDVPANWIRAASGVPIGVAGAWLVVRHALAGPAPVLSPSGDEVN